MSRTGRNEPCPCGSGRKAKRCCGTPRGPSDEQLARGLVARHARRAASALVPLEIDELEVVFDQLATLPARDLSLMMPLPGLVSPELACLYQAVRAEDPHAAAQAMPAILATLDTPQIRARLAGAVADLEGSGRIERHLAAVALVDLGNDSSILVGASLMQAALVAVGVRPTPQGLLVA